MPFYEIPEEYYFRLHHVRPRFKGNVENVLIYMATEITRIGNAPAAEFNAKLNDAIRCFPGNATLKIKTINNWRTEISSLFGLFYEDDDKNNHACLRARELAESGDLVRFFKQFLYYFQYPGAHIKTKDIGEEIEHGVRFKPAQYFLKVLQAGEKLEKKRVYITKEEACYCIFNDLRCTRDNESPEQTWTRIKRNRVNLTDYEPVGDVTRYAGDILDYMELANLLVSYNGKDFYINHRENESIIKFVNSTEWFDEYDGMIRQRKATYAEINACRSDWFEYVNRKEEDTDFSTNITEYISQANDDKEERNERMQQFAVYLQRIQQFEKLKTKDIGDIGETLVEGHECQRLKMNGREDLVHLVKKIPTELAVGYDISSRELDATLRNIEVKTTISSKPIVFNKVHLTQNEWGAAASYKERYFIYRLMISHNNIKLFIMANPVQLYKNDLIDIFPNDGMDITFSEKSGTFEELLAWKEN